MNSARNTQLQNAAKSASDWLTKQAQLDSFGMDSMGTDPAYIAFVNEYGGIPETFEEAINTSMDSQETIALLEAAGVSNAEKNIELSGVAIWKNDNKVQVKLEAKEKGNFYLNKGNNEAYSTELVSDDAYVNYFVSLNIPYNVGEKGVENIKNYIKQKLQSSPNIQDYSDEEIDEMLDTIDSSWISSGRMELDSLPMANKIRDLLGNSANGVGYYENVYATSDSYNTNSEYGRLTQLQNATNAVETWFTEQYNKAKNDNADSAYYEWLDANGCQKMGNDSDNDNPECFFLTADVLNTIGISVKDIDLTSYKYGADDGYPASEVYYITRKNKVCARLKPSANSEFATFKNSDRHALSPGCGDMQGYGGYNLYNYY